MKILEFAKKNKLICFVVLAYIAVLAISPPLAKKAIDNTVYYLVEMLEVLPVIFIFTVVIDAWVPTQAIIKGFGNNSGIKGNVLALALGSLSAGPIYAAFPIAKMLMKKGASVTNVVIILSAWAVVKVPMLANEAKFLGPVFMALRWVLTVAAIFAMAYITALIVKNKNLPETARQSAGNALEINDEYCIGCGLCAKMESDFFGMKHSCAYAKDIPVEEKEAENVKMVAVRCPANAIVFTEASD